MTDNRRLALSVALGHFLSENVTPDAYEELSIEEFAEAVDNGEVDFWQPFEYWTAEMVCSEIEALADTVERVLETKESYIKEMLTNMDSDQVFDYCNSI